MFNSKTKNTLRWVALPFAAFIGALLGSILLGIFSWWGAKLYGGFYEDGWYYRYLMPVFTSGAFGYFFSLISLAVAPKSKIIAATVMVTLLGVLSLVSIGLAWQMHYSHGLIYFIEVVIGCIVGMIAAIVTLVDYEE